MSRAFYLQNALALIAIAAGGRFLMPGDRREGFGSSSIHNEKLKTSFGSERQTVLGKCRGLRRRLVVGNIYAKIRQTLEIPGYTCLYLYK